MHKAKYCIITCIDFRLQKSYSSIIQSRSMLGESDIISLAGCSRDLVKPLENWHKEALLRQIKLSVKLHSPSNIILLDHQDCGGYAQDGTIPNGLSVDEDKKAHMEWGNAALDILEAKFPEINIEWYFVRLDGKVESI